MLNALFAADAVAGLANGRNGSVVTDKVGSAEFAVILLLCALCDLTFIDALVVMLEYSRNVNPVRARHAVLAVVAVDGRETGHDAGDLRAEELLLLVGQVLEVLESAQVVLKVLLIDHPAEDCQDSRVRSHESERP